MMIDKLVNLFLAVFGSTWSGRRVLFHSQNLTEGLLPHHGRCWLNVRDRVRFSFEWNLWGPFCGVALSVEPSERKVSLNLALPPLSFWWSCEGLGPWGAWERLARGRLMRWWLGWIDGDPTGWNARHGLRGELEVLSVRVHHRALWWCFLKPSNWWSSSMPWWVSGSLHPGRLLGKHCYEERLVEKRSVSVLMPEGPYQAEAELKACTRGRRLWPWKHRSLECEVSMLQPIPFSGKGENAWDCGEDALHSSSVLASSIEEALGKVVERVLDLRRQRGDPEVWPRSPAPMGVHVHNAAQPKEEHMQTAEMNGIGWAVKQMQNGEKVGRRGWNGRGMWLGLQVPDANSKMTEPYVFMKTAQGGLIPWLCSQADLLSTDWEIVRVEFAITDTHTGQQYNSAADVVREAHRRNAVNAGLGEGEP